MAKIKITKSCTGERFSYSRGDVVDVDPKVAKALIKANYAVESKEDETKA